MAGAQVEVEMTVTESWGVASGAVQRLTPIRRTVEGRGQAPPLTGPAAAAAAGAFEQMIELLLDAASTELLLRRLAEALRRTSRQVNTLENRVAPGLSSEIHRVRALLEERAQDHTRLSTCSGRQHPLPVRQSCGITPSRPRDISRSPAWSRHRVHHERP
jgi:vacuolar-type H+-ATPase subunit D/Vma8